MSQAGVPGLVSVVLPCYQAEAFVGDALDSLLGQSYAHLEILALDDGSTDGTRGILEGAAAADARVRVLVNGENRGLIATLNRGVTEARGEFIARMDADDLALPRRFERQVGYLVDHPDVGVLGSGAELIDEGGRSVGRLAPRCLGTEAAGFMVLLATPVAHPTLLARSEVMRLHAYSGEARALHTEDYELLTRVSAAGVGIANVPHVLLRRRIHSGSVSQRHEALQGRNFVACSKAFLEGVLGEALPEGAHKVLVNRMDDSVGSADLVAGMRLLTRLEASHRARARDAAGEIGAVATQQRIDILIQAFLKGKTGVKLAALALLLRHLPGLMTHPAWRYLLSKA